MKQQFIEKMTGYKATDKDMKCRGFQFELGVWYEATGELKECENGFHFCEQPSGVWAYYSEQTTRVFKVEAERVLATAFQPGANYKRVAYRIRLVEEVVIGGNRNTGRGNTGDWNTGDWNTGNRNTGNWNTGNRNTGDWNTGNSNTGNSNTGNRNTGDWNTGDWNTGNSNTGNRNTGNWNTGDWNTGRGSATNRSAGFFCIEPQTVKCFDVDTKLTYEEFTAKFPKWSRLCEDLMKSDPIDFDAYKELPGITKAKLKALHEKHLKGSEK